MFFNISLQRNNHQTKFKLIMNNKTIMKSYYLIQKTKILLFSVITLLLFTNCNLTVIPLEDEYENKQLPSSCYSVSLEDVSLLVRHSYTRNGGISQKASIAPIVDEYNDTLLYAVNYDGGGWKLFSSDKRITPIIAESKTGSYEDELKNEASLLWISIIADQVKDVKMIDNNELALTEEEINENVNYWDSFCSDNLDFEKTRAGNHPIKFTPGHYELYNTRTETIYYDSIEHLTQTHWHQNSPYNYYCPTRTDKDEKAFAGCVAIAGSQMLYYLHNTIGRPITAPSSASCVGNINWYEMSQSDYSSSIWSYMNISGIYAAPLVANVGTLLETQYGNEGSSAHTQDLVNKVFLPYGISCDYQVYSEDSVKKSLTNNMPVIVRADGKQTHILGVPINSKGHSFIVDGYRRYRVKYTQTYKWIYDDYDTSTGQVARPIVDDSIHIVFSSPYISHIKMNWGWTGQWTSGTNDTWYALTGNWITNQGTEYEANYKYERHMISHFKAIN